MFITNAEMIIPTAIALFAPLVAARFNGGVGKLPVMGYDTYNAFGSDYNGSVALEQIAAMKKLGLIDLGYNTFILDDFQYEINRTASGELVGNKAKFPQGIVKWTQQAKKYGVTISPYSSNGLKTCGGYPGGYGHELQDLETWRSWGWSYMVKYDNCNFPADNITQQNEYGRYQRMTDAIDHLASKYKEVPFIYSLCQWGWENPHNWAPRIAQAWRIDGDIKPYWYSIATVLKQASESYLATGFYQHGDMDMLEVGNSGQGVPVGDLTYDEQKTHFTAWALLKSHLLIGTDLRNATKETIEILTNKEIIAINQDPNEGQAIAPFRTNVYYQAEDASYTFQNPPGYWAGNSTYGPIFMIINTADTVQTLGFNLTENWAVRAGRQYKVRDLWLHKNVGTAVRSWNVTLPPHGVAAFLLKDDGPEPANETPQCAEPWLAIGNCAHYG